MAIKIVPKSDSGDAGRAARRLTVAAPRRRGRCWLRGKPLIPVLGLGLSLVLSGSLANAGSLSNLAPMPDASGAFATYSTMGSIDTSNPFFQSLGTNGRSCATCHAAAAGWGLTPALAHARFLATDGKDPLFRSVDGSNSPLADVSTVKARQAAYSMLLNKAVIRVGLPVPAGAEFHLVAADDPYGYVGSGADPLGPNTTLSLFRRPLPAANLPFLSAVMWDGRETVQPLLAGATPAQNLAALHADLVQQAVDATLGHAQAASPPSALQAVQIADFELALYAAQVSDRGAGSLSTLDSQGGPVPLSRQSFHIGVNDALGGDPSGADFDDRAVTLFSRWDAGPARTPTAAARAAIARGEAIFNSHPIAITGVGGLNDALGQPTIQGTCSTCHDTPNVGNHSVAAALDIGVSAASRRTPDLPLYTLHCDSGPLAGQTFQTTDPGRALITGKCADIDKFKGPVLRDLAARAPYFHNGSAATLGDVVDFYNARFQIGLSAQETADLVAFLQAL